MSIKRVNKTTWQGKEGNLDFTINKSDNQYHISIYDSTIPDPHYSLINNATVDTWEEVEQEIEDLCSVLA